MRIDPARGRPFPHRSAAWCLSCAAALALQVLFLGSLAFEIGEPWDKLWHFLAYAGITLLLWIATDGRRPQGVVLSVIALAAADEALQGLAAARTADAFDFLAGFLAAVLTAVALSITQGNKATCAESSRRSPAGTSSRS